MLYFFSVYSSTKQVELKRFVWFNLSIVTFFGLHVFIYKLVFDEAGYKTRITEGKLNSVVLFESCQLVSTSCNKSKQRQTTRGNNIPTIQPDGFPHSAPQHPVQQPIGASVSAIISSNLPHASRNWSQTALMKTVLLEQQQLWMWQGHWTRCCFSLVEHFSTSTKGTAPRESQPHTLDGNTHLRARTQRCKPARGASEGYILSPGAPAATSLKAKILSEGAPARVQFSVAVLVYIFSGFFLPTTSCLCMT